MNTDTTARRAIPDDLRELSLTFTITGLDTVKAYREKLAYETGRRITLAKALDALIKSHPFATGRSAEVSA